MSGRNATFNSSVKAFENDTHQRIELCNRSDGLSVFLIVSFTILALVGMSGYFLLTLVVWKTKPMRNPTNLLLASFNVSGLIYLLFCTPCYIIFILASYVKISTSEQLMNLYKLSRATVALETITTYVSTITLALLAVERYNALVHPMKLQRRLSKRSAKIAIFVIWFISTTVTMVRFVSAQTSPNDFLLLFIRIFVATYMVVPAAVVAFCYGKIIFGIYVAKNICSQGHGTPQDIKDKKNLVKMLVLLATTFMVPKLAELSFFVIVMSSWSYALHLHCSAVLHLGDHLICCLYPIIYVTYSSNYRRGVRRLLRCRLCTEIHNLS